MTDNFPGTTQETTELAAEAAASWCCPTCSLSSVMPYCSRCGERQPHPQELTLLGLARQAFEALTSYDSRLLQTFRKLMFAPGSLTRMYLEGSRKPYLGPFSLFLLANVMFVAVEALTGSNAFSTPLARELITDEQIWSAYAQQLVAGHLQQTGQTLADYEPIFDQAVANNSKSFIFLMVLPFAFLTGLVFSGQRKPFASHLVYALHFHAFLLTFISWELLVIWLGLQAGGAGMVQLADDIMSVTLLVVCALYLYLSTLEVYQANLSVRIAKAVVLATAATAVFLGYRFVLFMYTLYTT